MKELNFSEVNSVAGGLKPPATVHPGMNVRIALRTFPGLGLVAGAATAGWTAGNWLNDNTPIQKWIASGLDALTN